jgi:hypothetical protein
VYSRSEKGAQLAFFRFLIIVTDKLLALRFGLAIGLEPFGAKARFLECSRSEWVVFNRAFEISLELFWFRFRNEDM